ncbi:pirin family protein [Nocardioides sp. Bht2]|uniref:pirin family protein n=1 Tax=Nocardioides sp. Bht2 TaxID=3392297 RepID=UPI0039B3CBE4
MTATSHGPATTGRVVPLGGPWPGVGPFLFTAYHLDAYPAGNADLGPAEGVAGHAIGQDFGHPSGWNMYHGDTVPGFPAHPHRGFETITIVRQGIVDHADSTGAAARYGQGDVQWVTAGSGVVHSEMFPLLNSESDNPFELYQIWINLPAVSKMADPEFTMMWNEQLPVVESDGVQVRVIAGSFGDAEALGAPVASWASRPEADVTILLIDLEPNASITLPATGSDRTERMLYVHGAGGVDAGGNVVASGEGFAPDGTGEVTITAGEAPSVVLLLQGVAIGEPVAQAGPFVMNNRAELVQAYEDYQRTQFGGWPWPSTAPVHPADADRFAVFGDGRREEPAAR